MKVDLIVELYCDCCDRHTNHKFLHNFKDGIHTYGRYLCKECGTEQEDEPIYGYSDKEENN